MPMVQAPPQRLAGALSRIARLQAKTGDLGGAVETAAEIPQPGQQVQTRLEIADQLGSQVPIGEAAAVLGEFSTADEKLQFIMAVASRHVRLPRSRTIRPYLKRSMVVPTPAVPASKRSVFRSAWRLG